MNKKTLKLQNTALWEEKANSPQLFNAIAKTYDPINTLLSFGMHHVMKKELLSHLPSRPLEELSGLDLATGTGDILLILEKSKRFQKLIGVDLSTKMLDVAKKKIKGHKVISVTEGDAQNISYENDSFEVVSISFGIRNCPDPKKVLAESYRVLKSNGKMLVLEFSLPKIKILKSCYLFYLRHLLPLIGNLFSKHFYAYTYLNKTIESFPRDDEFLNLMKFHGYKNCYYQPLFFGVANLYVGEK